jgi:hypothetical protein
MMRSQFVTASVRSSAVIRDVVANCDHIEITLIGGSQSATLDFMRKAFGGDGMPHASEVCSPRNFDPFARRSRWTKAGNPR